MKKIKKSQGGDTIYSKKSKYRNTDPLSGKKEEGTVHRFKVKQPSGDVEQGKVITKKDMATGETTTTKKTGVIKKSQSGSKIDKVAVKKVSKNPNIPNAKQQKNLKDATANKNMRPPFKNGGTLSPSKKNLLKTKKQATFKSGGKMETCKGGC